MQLEEHITWEGLTIKFNIMICLISFPLSSNTPQKLCTPCETVYALRKLNHILRGEIFYYSDKEWSLLNDDRFTSSWSKILDLEHKAVKTLSKWNNYKEFHKYGIPDPREYEILGRSKTCQPWCWTPEILVYKMQRDEEPEVKVIFD